MIETRAAAAEKRAETIHEILRGNEVTIVAHVPDGGHAALIARCEHDPAMQTVVLTTEEEGVALAAGAWLGGLRAVLLIQSSGVGNIINALSLTDSGKFPLLIIVTMRGEWGEQMAWQVPMGRATRSVLEAMGVMVYEAERDEDVAEIVEAGASLAFGSGLAVAVLISQRILGTKKFD